MIGRSASLATRSSGIGCKVKIGILVQQFGHGSSDRIVIVWNGSFCAISSAAFSSGVSGSFPRFGFERTALQRRTGGSLCGGCHVIAAAGAAIKGKRRGNQRHLESVFSQCLYIELVNSLRIRVAVWNAVSMVVLYWNGLYWI